MLASADLPHYFGGGESAWRSENVKDVGKFFTHSTARPTSTQSTEASVSIAGRTDPRSHRKVKVTGIDSARHYLNGISACNTEAVLLTVGQVLLG